MRNYICLFIGLTLGISGITNAETPVYFADPNLKAAVEDELGVFNPTPTDMLSLIMLCAVDIVSLTGLEYATNLTGLFIVFGNISDISPLSGLTNLTELYLWYNNISDISPISGLTNLMYLELCSNNISDISPLSGLTNLTELYLGYNNISDISPISGLTNLMYLELWSNNISDISPLSGLTNLAYLCLEDNPLNSEAYSTYLPLILANNPGILLTLPNLEYPCYLLGAYDADDDGWKGIDAAGNWPVTVIPESLLIGPPPSDLSAVTFASGDWVELRFCGEIVDGPGDDIVLIEWGTNGEQAHVYLTDGIGHEQLVGTATAATSGGQDPTEIGFDISGIMLSFTPYAIRIIGVDDLGGIPGFDLGNVRVRVTGTPPPTKKRLIIDTDPAVGDSDVDDGTAIIYAFQSPDLCTIEGITYGYGNFGHQIPDSDGTRGANRMLDYYQLQLNKILEVLQEDGAIDTVPPIYRGHKESETWDDNDDHLPNHASIFINDTVKNNPNEITIVALGTLTNIAIAMQHYNNEQGGLGPVAFMQDCKELWIIGGGIIINNNVFEWEWNESGFFLAISEWNIWRDRKAAEYVFKYSVLDETGTPKIKMVPLDATMRWIIDTDDITTVENTDNRISNYLTFPLRWWVNEANPLDCRQVADPLMDWLENAKIAIARGMNASGGINDLGDLVNGINLLGLDWFGDPQGSFENAQNYIAGLLPINPAFPPYDTIGMALVLEPDIATWQENHKIYVSSFPLNAGQTVEDDTLSDREEVHIFYDYNEPNMTERIVNRWKRYDFHDVPENKEFVECSSANYVVRYFSDGYEYEGPINVSDDIDGYCHLPVGLAPYYSITDNGMFRGRLLFDIDFSPGTLINDIKLHIYCDKRKDWFDIGHRTSIYYCDPFENDPNKFWNSVNPENQYVADTHIGTLQVWRTVNLGPKATAHLQNVLPLGKFALLLAEDNDDHPCAWFDTSKDWKAYLEVDYEIQPIPGDLDGDSRVDSADVEILTNKWLLPPGTPSADIFPPGGDDIVNFKDFSILASHWLEGAGP